MRNLHMPSSQSVWQNLDPSSIAIRAAGLAVAFLVLGLVGGGLASALIPGEEGARFYAVMKVDAAAAIVSGVVSVLAGLIAIIRGRERSIQVILAMAFGGLVAWFLFFEAFIGHD
jgi:hypothetical protein